MLMPSTSSGSPGTQTFGPSLSHLFLAHYQGAELEVHQLLDRKLATMCDAGMVGSVISCYATMPVSSFFFLSIFHGMFGNFS